jgi:MarR family transcriptional regulator, 2-MHQ and catechol-resistance regulon repressor
MEKVMPTKYQGAAREVHALDAYIKLMRASGSVAAKLNKELSRSQMTESQFGVLEALLHLGPLHQCEIAAKLLKSGANITLVLDNLEKRGLVTRQADARDRRSTIVELSEEGRRVISETFPIHAAFISDLMSALNPDEQHQLGRLCRKLGRAAANE